ncbi:MAG: pilus assembly protein PilQ [Desulfobacterales bacterium]|nr:MAG: pilus assembly protein PilQ [Desulfobacterales bacterium]
MDHYQSAVKKYGVTLISSLLALFLVTGCVARQAEKPEPAKEGESLQADRVLPVENNLDVQRVVEDITIHGDDGQVKIWIQANKDLEYTSIKQPFPFTVTVYLPDTALVDETGIVQGEDSRIGGVKAGYADEAQTMAKVDILLTKDLPYTVIEDGKRLGIILHEEMTGNLNKDNMSEVADSVSEQEVRAADVSDVSMVEVDENLTIPNSQAELINVEFTSKDTGQSDIRIETSHPVRYDTSQIDDDTFYLTLYNTKIPYHQQRPLLTRYFNSVVERVDPRPYPGAKKDTRIDIKLRDQVPFRVVQNRQGIHLSFEASSVKPPQFTKARKVLEADVRGVKEMPMSDGQGQLHTAAPINAQSNPILGIANGRYAGEKIKLDFFDTDIKNVFRILQSVSGLNFAIDENVQGKVTLSLGEAVPWDQVLDLVLRMNGLGKKMEGNVVRIATAETLQNEEEMRQSAIAARKKSLEQEKALEPLLTEYIPINYSDAKADIEPHVTKILTPERGKLSVDTRTNMIIITDTRQKIAQANELIYRLDKVTPQIMIEAKVVEVSKEFKRSLGTSWNLSNASSITNGFVDDFGAALNVGSNIGFVGDFSFFRLFGSSVTALNAQLEASEEQGDVKIVSSPRIMTLDNKKAMIKQGQEYAYLERDDSGGSSVKFKDVDLLLEVTPHVTPDHRISMTVKLTKNDVASLTTTGVPILNTNEAETELLVNNRETIVIGGVVKQTLRQDDDGLPFLSGIPGLGLLFSREKKEDLKNELLIFLTPSIVQLEQKRNVSRNAQKFMVN